MKEKDLVQRRVDFLSQVGAEEVWASEEERSTAKRGDRPHGTIDRQLNRVWHDRRAKWFMDSQPIGWASSTRIDRIRGSETSISQWEIVGNNLFCRWLVTPDSNIDSRLYSENGVIEAIEGESPRGPKLGFFHRNDLLQTRSWSESKDRLEDTEEVRKARRSLREFQTYTLFQVCGHSSTRSTTWAE